MFLLIEKLWVYRGEIILAIQLLAKLRRSAQQMARDYIRRKIETKLKQSIAVVLFQIGLFVAAIALDDLYPSLFSRLAASTVLWAVTLYNVTCFVFLTIPEVRTLHQTMKGKTGYMYKYLLEVSLVTELLRLNILFLAICLVLGISTRTFIGAAFSYTKPWKQLVQSAPLHPRRRPPR